MRFQAAAAVLGICASVFAGLSPAMAQSVTPSITVDPDQVSATADLTVALSAPYCGGFQVGDGVYLSPEAPLALPASIPDGSVLFAGQPASVALVNGALRVSVGPGLAQSMICASGDRPLSVELLPAAGFALPDAPGDYTVDVWTGARPTPTSVTFTVPDADS